MNASIIRKAILATATVMMVSGGAAMAMQPQDNAGSTAAATNSDRSADLALFHQALQNTDHDHEEGMQGLASPRIMPMPWYESGFANKTQLHNQIQAGRNFAGDNG